MTTTVSFGKKHYKDEFPLLYEIVDPAPSWETTAEGVFCTECKEQLTLCFAPGSYTYPATVRCNCPATPGVEPVIHEQHGSTGTIIRKLIEVV
jgi:hypothetical protein